MRDALCDLRRRAFARSAFRSAEAHGWAMNSGFPQFIGSSWAWRFGDHHSLLRHRHIARSEWRKLFLANLLHQLRRDRIDEGAAGVDEDETLALDAGEAFVGKVGGALASVRAEE